VIRGERHDGTRAHAAPIRRCALAALLAFPVACAPTRLPQLTPEERWTEQEVSVMVQAEDLEQFLNDPITDSDTAVWTKLRSADGSLRLGYEYFSVLHGLGLSWVVRFHASVADARREMAEAEAALARREDPGPDGTERIEDFYEWGDESVFAVVKVGGEPGGDFFFARYGATTVSLSLVGVYFFDGAEFNYLVGPALSNLLFYHPESADE
jgi:hypothetical protein